MGYISRRHPETCEKLRFTFAHMSTQEILQQIAQLSPQDKLLVVEKTIGDLLKSTSDQQMQIAATALENDYRTDVGLITFSTLDSDDFYETK